MAGYSGKLVIGVLLICAIAGLQQKAPRYLNATKTSPRASEGLLGVSQSHHNPTPADYWQPLDAWLKFRGSPLSGRDAYEVGRQYGIDPDLLIAITKAETDLCKVKQRGSQYNCGSVGSYDSTNTTFTAQSYRHGFEQIAQTLTNPLLRNYTRVSQLSRARNPSGPIYASSEHNWDANVISTMSELKGLHQEDYWIRLSPH